MRAAAAAAQQQHSHIKASGMQAHLWPLYPVDIPRVAQVWADAAVAQKHRVVYQCRQGQRIKHLAAAVCGRSSRVSKRRVRRKGRSAEGVHLQLVQTSSVLQ